MIEDIGYLNALDQIAFYPWTVDAVRALNRADLPVVVTTNQSGIAKGFLTEAFLDTVHREVTRVLAEGGAAVTAYYYCPHHPRGTVAPYARACECRKPAAGLVERAARDLHLDPARSFVVGDKWLDVGLARAVGAKAVLVRTGFGALEETHPLPGLAPDVVVDNLAAAASWILQSLKSEV